MSGKLLRVLAHSSKVTPRGHFHFRSLQTSAPTTMSMLDYFRKKKGGPGDSSAKEENEEEASQIFSLEETVPTLTEEEIEQKRNKSRLRDFEQKLVNGQVPYTEPKYWTHHTVAFKRKMYGRYGEASQVNPSIIWPTMSQLREKIEYEEICNPHTIPEMVRKIREIRAAEKDAIERREREIDERMKLLDKFKADLNAKLEEKDRLQLQAKLRRDKLMDEVRRHFGYTVDPKDEKFQEMLAKKEKEQRKQMKEARKMEKQQKQLDRMEDLPSAKSSSKSRAPREG